ncbi:coiled-coil domain-containing protein 27-like isoform X1 [Clavelina lepadiformis]|uniref:coiled-coil domain-containing protein 27-like isoform X1 n=1 Tax=Clavelina lepadiformis TaxID=159417 RepID=UPI00404212A1
MMRGYLSSPTHQYRLDAEVISVGKGLVDKNVVCPTQLQNVGAHIPLDSGKAEPYHAVVARKPDEKCYILTDLNTAYGTYVNNHRIQNGTVKLSPGDVIRFGHGGIPHEFAMSFDDKMDDTPKMTNERASSAASFSSIGQRKNSVESGYFENRRQRPMSSKTRPTATFGEVTMRPDTAPTSPKLIAPPFSTLALGEKSKSIPINFKMSGEKTNGMTTNQQHPHDISPRDLLNGHDESENIERETLYSKTSTEKGQQENEPWYVAMLREKEQRLLHMGDEISRLSATEAECRRKDDVISDLRNKVADMEQQILVHDGRLLRLQRHSVNEVKNNTNAAERSRKLLEMGDEINRLAVFERECERKDRLVASLRDEVANLEINRQAMLMEMQDLQQQQHLESSRSVETASITKENYTVDPDRTGEKLGTIDSSLLHARDSLDEFRKELDLPIPDRREPEEIVIDLQDQLEQKNDIIIALQEELSMLKKEKNLSDGLVQTLQRNVNQRENKLNKMTIALEKSKQKVAEADAQARSMSNKFANLKEEKKHEEMVAVMEQDLIKTHEELATAQKRLSRQQEKLDKQSKELRRANRQNKQYFDSGRLSQAQADELSTEVTELRQKEQSTRVANEHTQARLERLRSRIVQAVYTAPGAVKPESQLNDGEILHSIQKIIDDRSDFHQQLSDLGQNVAALLVTIEPPADDTSGSEGPSNTPTTERRSAKSARKSAKR